MSVKGKTIRVWNLIGIIGMNKLFQHIYNDNVKKYLMMKTLLKQQKIHFKTITTYTSEQNEMAEKLNRTLVTTAKEMLL